MVTNKIKLTPKASIDRETPPFVTSKDSEYAHSKSG